jgi:hypothetical protein
MRSHWSPPVFAAFLFLCGYGLTIADEQRNISRGDCTFFADRDQLLTRGARFRRDLFVTAQKVAATLPRAAFGPATASIPHRNFIDDTIFGTLASRGVPTANLTTDEEFFRRINLDLVGRIPAPGEIRAFVADPTDNKRDVLINQLLYSPAFATLLRSAGCEQSKRSACPT